MPFRMIRADIITIYADMIVSAASALPVISRGNETALYQAAGRKNLLEMRKKIGTIAAGDAAVSPAFRLNADYVIHTVCPVWIDGEHQERELLESCYRKCLALAEQYGCASIAFPLLASGTPSFPNETALETALECFREFLQDHEMTIYLAVPDRNAFAISEDLFHTVADYIDRNQVDAPQIHAEYPVPPAPFIHYDSCDRDDRPTEQIPVLSIEYEQKLSCYINLRKEQTFQARLLKLIDASGETDPVIYRRANLDRKLFSRIRKDENYHPSKKTVIAFALALKLSMDDAADLLSRAGFALSKASTSDLIISWCIENGIYSIIDVNAILFSFDQELL